MATAKHSPEAQRRLKAYRLSTALVFLLGILIVPMILIRMGIFENHRELLSMRSIPLLVLFLPFCSLLGTTFADIFLCIRSYTVCTVPLEATYLTALIFTQEYPDERYSRLFAPAWQYEYEGRPYSAENDFALTPLMLKDHDTCTIHINPRKPWEYRRSFAIYIPNLLKTIVGLMVIGFFLYVLINTMYS